MEISLTSNEWLKINILQKFHMSKIFTDSAVDITHACIQMLTTAYEVVKKDAVKSSESSSSQLEKTKNSKRSHSFGANSAGILLNLVLNSTYIMIF